MNANNFGGNPYDNQDFLREQFLKLPAEQQVAAFLAVAERYHREKCSREELAGIVQSINRQYERALTRISALQNELRQAQQPNFEQAA